MKSLYLFLTMILASGFASAKATSDAGDEPKKIIECGIYHVYQDKYASAFKGIIHLEHRYRMVNSDSKEEMNIDFKSHSEGADLSAVEIYEHNPATGAAIKYRKLSIVSWNHLFYMDVTESTGIKSKINCSVVH